jgi:hypothetical protein
MKICVEQWRLVRGGRVGSAHPKPNDIFFFNFIFIFKFINYLFDDLLLESKCFYRQIKTFPRRIFLRVDMSSLFPERCSLKYESSTRIMANRAKLRKKETEVETFV